MAVGAIARAPRLTQNLFKIYLERSHEARGGAQKAQCRYRCLGISSAARAPDGKRGKIFSRFSKLFHDLDGTVHPLGGLLHRGKDAAYAFFVGGFDFQLMKTG